MGPCQRKLLRTGDRVQDSIQFTMYVETLVEERVILFRELDEFFKSLDQRKITNPIVQELEKASRSFHYKEFQLLIDSKNLDIETIKKWSIKYQAKINKTKKQKDTAKTESKVMPDYIGPDGSMFYKFKHPILGTSYKILKPGGRYGNQEDWEKPIWPVDILKDKKTAFDVELTNEYGEDPLNQAKVSVNSPARKGCLKLGDGIDLPTREDYMLLLSHFEHADKVTVSLSKKGLEQFSKMFRGLGFTWTATVFRGPSGNAGSAWKFGGWTGMLNTHARTNYHYVRCVGVK